MIFIKILTEKVVQENDKTRIDVSSTFASGVTSGILSYEIEPYTGHGYIDVTSDKYLDWAYSASGDQIISVKITEVDLTEHDLTSTLTIKTIAEDNLFSEDTDISPYEPNLHNWVQEGRNSFLDKHRTAQIDILNDLDAARIWKNDGTRYEASDIVDIQEFKEWSKFLTLKIIFEGISNDIGDVFSVKATKYDTLAVNAKKRATLRLDPNADGVNTISENVDNFTGELVRG